MLRQARECVFFDRSRGDFGLSLAGSRSSELAPGTRYFRRASGRFDFARELGICDLSFEARLIFPVAEFQHVLEAHLVTIESNLLDESGSVERAHVRIDSQPLLLLKYHSLNLIQ